MRAKSSSKNIAVLLILSLSLLGCASNPPNEPVCKELSLTEGVCTKMLSGETFIVDEANKLDGKTWWELRPYMLHVPATTWAEIKKFIVKMCKKYGCADPEIASWDRAVQNIDKQITDPGAVAPTVAP